MKDATIHANFLAIRERIKFINLLRAENSPQADRAGLISAHKVIDAFARRYIQSPDWPGRDVPESTRLLWEYEWYCRYCEATAAYCKAVQTAVKDKRLTLRNTNTRLPVEQGKLTAWLLIDIDALFSEEQHGFMTRIEALSPTLGRWLDNVCLPTAGALDAEDVATWANAEGLAYEADIRQSPNREKPQAAPEPAPVVCVPAREPKAPATGPTFTMKKAAMVEQYKHKWPDIEGDMKDASRNGLDAAKAGAREWDKDKAMEWANAKGKLVNADKSAHPLTGAFNIMASLPTSRKHTLDG